MKESYGGHGPDLTQTAWRYRRTGGGGLRRHLAVRGRTVVWQSGVRRRPLVVVWRAGVRPYIGRLAEPAGRLERIVCRPAAGPYSGRLSVPADGGGGLRRRLAIRGRTLFRSSGGASIGGSSNDSPLAVRGRTLLRSSGGASIGGSSDDSRLAVRDRTLLRSSGGASTGGSSDDSRLAMPVRVDDFRLLNRNLVNNILRRTGRRRFFRENIHPMFYFEKMK